jgi:hypothetical protein
VLLSGRRHSTASLGRSGAAAGVAGATGGGAAAAAFGGGGDNPTPETGGGRRRGRRNRGCCRRRRHGGFGIGAVGDLAGGGLALAAGLLLVAGYALRIAAAVQLAAVLGLQRGGQQQAEHGEAGEASGQRLWDHAGTVVGHVHSIRRRPGVAQPRRRLPA